MHGDVTVRFITPLQPEYREAKQLRYAVLYGALDIPESQVDWGDDEPDTSHCVVFERGDMVGYGRLVLRGDQAQIRHLAVLASRRGRGVGTVLLDALLERASQLGVTRVYLNARLTTLGLYLSKGFEPVGPTLHTESTHLPHQRMERALP